MPPSPIVRHQQASGPSAAQFTRVQTAVERLAGLKNSVLLEYRQFQAAVNSGRPVFVGSALERLVGRSWDELPLMARAHLLALARALRHPAGAERVEQLLNAGELTMVRR